MNYNNTTYNNPEDIVNGFASYFSSAYLSVSASDILDVDFCNCPDVSIRGFTDVEVGVALSKLKNKMTAGADGIPSFLLRDCSCLGFPLTVIFNLSLSTATFPDLWKDRKVLIDLNDRLNKARPFTPPLEGVQQQYGMNTKLLSEIVEFWKTHYNWREREQWMNRYPQFTTNIQGLDIHYIHVKPTQTDGVKVLPLLLLHGWPGSVREFYEIIPLLTTPRKGENFVFEVIIPSLPGYGFSQAAAKPGLGAPQMAVVFRNLMARLGYDKYYIQGGDWGAIIVQSMATLFPDKILGVHSNMCSVVSPLATLKLILGSFYPPLVVDKEFEHRLYPLSSFFEFLLLEFGYMHIQATKPDTVGVGLNDSPVGLAAYILEKFTTWTNLEWKNRADGGLKQKYSYVDLLDNVMIYWVTNSITTSARLYAETFNKATMGLHLSSIPITIPSACARLPHELADQPDSILSLKYKNLIHSSDLEDGGHFAAFEVLVDLQNRLKNARPFTPPLEGVQQQYGMNTNLLSEIVEFWKTRYNWRDREQWMNRYPQFMTNIQGLNIHYIHVKPTVTNGLKVIPLLLLHGWPGSVREFYGIIPMLLTPRKGENFVFEVIIPSLPGYGFSQAAAKPGLGAAQMAVVFKNLMSRLGFDKYYIQGGDWGALIVSNMATLYPDKILGMHNNMCFLDSPMVTLKFILGSFYPSLVVDKEFEHRIYPLSSFFEFMLLEFGYMHLQATKPDTVGVGLNDSPVGLAAYILEKFTTWTNVDWKNRADGGLKQKYSYVDLLDNVMMYWITNSITTSMRLYAETTNKAQRDLKLSSIPVTVPSACARLPHELAYQPDSLLTLKYKNLIHSSDLQDGGHFAAFEVPEMLANDVWAAISKMENYYKAQKNTK